MATDARHRSRARVPLSRERVLRAAVKVADEGGIESVTMRRLADELGTEAMSLYYHVARKEDILDGLAEVIARQINDAVGQIPPPSDESGWKAVMRQRILCARQILLRHPWAPGVLGTRSGMIGEVLRYIDGVLGLMRAGGFSYDLAHHALHALGSRALGFSQELFAPSDAAAQDPAQGPVQDPAQGPAQRSAGDDAAAAMAAMAGQFPHLAGMLAQIVHDDPESTLGWCDDQAEFEFGLDVILDGLDRLRQAQRG